MRVFHIIIVILLVLFAIGLLCYQYFVEGALETSNTVKAVIIILGAISSLFRKPRQGILRKKDYQATYGHLIGKAFCDDPNLEKKFYNALGLFNKGKYANAVAELQKLYRESPRSADRFAISTFIGICTSRMGLYQEAISNYSKALVIQEHSSVLSNMGSCYQALGDMENATECFKRAIRADSANANPYNNLAQLYIQLGEYELALPYAEEAVAINGKFYQALNAITVCHAMLGNDTEYETYFRRAVACGSDGKNLRAYIENLKS